MNTPATRFALTTLVILLLAACGGGSSGGGGAAGGDTGGGDTGGGDTGGGDTGGGDTGGGDPGDPVFGINGGGAWVVAGTFSRFGSVVVNGVRYDVSDSEIIVNGQVATEADLAQGQVLAVRGEVAVGGLTGTAERVEYENALRGAVQVLDAGEDTLRILGQEVRVGFDTIYGPSIGANGFEALGVGDALVASGFRDSTGRLQATRLDRDDAPGTAEVRGVAEAVDAAAGTLRINGLVVDFSGAALEGFATGAPAAGDTVFVRGPQPPAGQALAADTLAARPAAVAASADENVDLEGLVTRFASLSDLDVAGLTVVIPAAAEFVASTPDEVVADALIDVEGVLDAQGRLEAVRVEVIPPADIEVEARIDTVNLDTGSVQLLGIEAFTTARTRFEDDDGRQLELADLRPGDAVQIAGYAREGRFTIVRLARDDDGGSEVEIEGPATQLAQPEFRIGGIRIVTDAATEFDGDDAALTAEAFFASGEGRRVEVEGSWNGEFVLAEEVEIED